jgi:hypothetical protein
MSVVHVAHKWNNGGVRGCHTGKAIGPVDDIEGVGAVVGEHNCVSWIGLERGIDGMGDDMGPTLDIDPELQRGEEFLRRELCDRLRGPRGPYR